MPYVFTPDPHHFNGNIAKSGYEGLAKSYVAERRDDGTYSLQFGHTRATFANGIKTFTEIVTANKSADVGFMINLNGTEVLVTGTLKFVTSRELSGLEGGRRRTRRSRTRRTRTRRTRTRRTRTRSRK